MQEPQKPDFDAYSGLEISGQKRWQQLISCLSGCEFAIFAIVAIAWFNKPLTLLGIAVVSSAIVVLGISGELIRVRASGTAGSKEEEGAS